MNGLGELTNEQVEPILAASGFKRRKFEWNRARGHFIDVVEIQTSPAGYPGREHFTLNAGIFIPSFYETVWQKSAGKFAREADCAVRARIGELLTGDFSGKARDTWWHLDGGQEFEKCRRELPKIVNGNILPFLERFRSMTDVLEFLSHATGWQGDYPLSRIYFALAKDASGDKEGAKNVLRTIAKGKNRAWADRAMLVSASI